MVKSPCSNVILYIHCRAKNLKNFMYVQIVAATQAQLPGIRVVTGVQCALHTQTQDTHTHKTHTHTHTRTKAQAAPSCYNQYMTRVSKLAKKTAKCWSQQARQS